MLESTEKRKEGKPETAAGGKTFGSKRPAAEITSGSSMEGNDREPLELGYDEPVGQIGGQPARRCLPQSRKRGRSWNGCESGC
mgnify:FL=1